MFRPRLKTTGDWLFALAVVGVFLASFLSRILWMTTFPPGLDQDEAVNGYDAYTLSLTGRDHHGDTWPILLQSFNDWVPVLLTYITVPFVMVFGLSTWTIRLVVALFGIASVGTMYLLCRQIGLSRWFSLIGTTIIGLAGWSIYLSHFAIPPSIVPFFACLFLIVLFYWLELPKTTLLKKKLLWGVAVGVVASLLTHAYSTMNLHIPVFFAGVGVLIWFLRPHLRLSFIVICTTFLVIVGPMLWITIMESDKYNARFNEITILNRPNPIGNFKRNYKQYLSYRFLFGEGNKNPMYQMPHFPLFPVVLALPLLVGFGALLYSFKNGVVQFFKKQRVERFELQAALLLFWIVLSPISPALARDSYHILRAIHLLPIVVLLMAIGLERIYRLISTAFSKQVAIDVIGLVLVIMVTVFLGYMKLATTTYPKLLNRYFNDGLDTTIPVLLSDTRCKSRLITHQITQPYIFYLFYSKHRPDNQLYEDLKKRMAIWDMRTSTPIQVGNVRFGPVHKEDVHGMTVIHREKASVPYAIYLSNEGDCVLLRDY